MSTDLCTSSICLAVHLSFCLALKGEALSVGRSHFFFFKSVAKLMAYILLLRKQTTSEMKCQLLDSICQ